MMQLLVFLAVPRRWLRCAYGQIVASGTGLPAPVADAELIVAVPGEAVALHWLSLPDLPPPQAQSAARLLAADLACVPIERLHVAVAPGSGLRPVALVAADTMTGWLAELAAAGLTPDRMVPDTLLLPPVPQGCAVLSEGSRWLVRGADRAFAAEAELAALLIGELPVTRLAAWDDDLPQRLARLPLDLRQGSFALHRPWRPAPGRLRRVGFVAAAAAGLWLAGDVAAMLRAQFAADAAEQRLIAAAMAVLPRGSVVTGDTARAAVAARAAALGAGDGASELLAAVTLAVSGQPKAVVTRLEFGPGRSARLVVEDGDTAALAAALTGAGFPATAADGTSLTVQLP